MIPSALLKLPASIKTMRLFYTREYINFKQSTLMVNISIYSSTLVAAILSAATKEQKKLGNNALLEYVLYGYWNKVFHYSEFHAKAIFR